MTQADLQGWPFFYPEIPPLFHSVLLLIVVKINP